MRNEKGSVLALCMVLLVVVTLLAVAGMQTGAFGNRIAGNNLEGQMAFWIAEAGLQDAKDKLNDAASVEAFRNLTGLSNPVGYAGGSYTITTFPDSFEPTRRVLVRSVGKRPGGQKTVEATLVKFTFDLPGALYSKSQVSINADKTTVFGNDACGGIGKPAIVTTKPEIDPKTGKPAIVFKNGKLYGNDLPSPVVDQSELKLVTEMGSSKDYPLVQYISAYKNLANVVSTDANIEGSKLPDELGNKGPDNWGASQITISTIDNPPRTTLIGDPTPNVIYLDPPANQATGVKEVSLSGDVRGHGLLLINGNVNIAGGFNWYGVIIASGGVKFSGEGGKSKNITGGVLAGETGVIVDINFTGSVELIYCSKVKSYLDDLTTVQMIAWREIKN
jgi:PilX N-terminal